MIGKASEQQSFRATKLQGNKASDRHRVKTTMGTVTQGCCGVMRLATMRSLGCVSELVRQGFQALIKAKAGAALGADSHQRTDQRGGHQHGSHRGSASHTHR